MDAFECTSKIAISKRFHVNEKGFLFPFKPVKEAAVPPVATSNTFSKLNVDLHKAGPSTSADPDPIKKKTRMPRIVINSNSGNELIRELKLIDSQEIDFE